MRYRETGRAAPSARSGSPGRRGHFTPERLPDSQFAALELPSADEDPITVPIETPVAMIADDIVTALSLRRASMTVPA